MSVKVTAGRDRLGNFAPTFAHMNDDVLFGEIWSRESELSPKIRSIVTIVSLVSQGIVDSSLKHHLLTGKNNGITREEIAEILTHNAFYAGWPKAWAAFYMAQEVWGDAEVTEETTSKEADLEAFASTMFFPVGQSNDAYSEWFSGRSWLAPLSPAPVSIANVTFEPGCQNNWHIHHADKGGGQKLICVAGKGYYQEWGKEPVEMVPGTVIDIPAGVKHWHGAAPDSWFAHLAIEMPGENCRNEWLEPSK